MLDTREGANENARTETANFIAVDYGQWSGNILGGIFRSTEGNILIRISEDFRDDTLTSDAISAELVARLHWHMAEKPLAKLWPITILVDKIPEVSHTSQRRGMRKLAANTR